VDGLITFGAWLKRYRGLLGLTQATFARRLGYALETYCKVEQGRLPSQAFLERLLGDLALPSCEHAAFIHFACTDEHPNPLALLPQVMRAHEAAAALTSPGGSDDHAAGEGRFPATGPRYQLRAPISDFVGRVDEVQRLREMLQAAIGTGSAAAISGVQGMGGIGKTELAYRVAHDLRDTFPSAQIVLNLRGSSSTPMSPTQALQVVIRTFTPDAQLPEDVDQLQQHYCTVLHDQRALILADDARDAAQVRPLLPPAGCALLITSRTRFTLPGMTTVDLEQLSEAEAVTLVRYICHRVSQADAQALARACGYLPLALRVAGGLLHTTPALAIAQYLMHLADERKRLIHLHNPDDPQLDVEASLTLSYAQLDATAQAVFRQLGVFVADFATPLAQAVVEVPTGVNVEVTLHHLQRRNLVLYDTGRGRWRLHDLVRDLALHYLDLADEIELVGSHYARAVVQIAEEIQDQYLAGGDELLAALARFGIERPHIDAGRGWALAHVGTPAGDQLLLDIMAATRYIGEIHYDVRRERIPWWGQTLTIAQRLGHQYHEGMALNHLGCAYSQIGEAQRAIPYYQQAQALAHNMGKWRHEGIALHNLASAYNELGDARCAIRYYEQRLILARQIGDERGEGSSLHNLGNAYTNLGKLRRATEACMASLIIQRSIGDRQEEGYALSYLARAQALQGNIAQATSAFEQALALFHDVGDRAGEAECQRLFGLALAQQGERECALPLLRAALAYEQEIGHAKAAEHAALLARLEAGEGLPTERHTSAGQRAIKEGECTHGGNVEC
jgi:tetratricopeptide (TPR) repeat protein/transcriptional regulator with XRE-family HTH domain